MLEEIESFVGSLSKVLRASANTVKSYRRDLVSFRAFLMERGAAANPDGAEVCVAAIDADHIRSYLTHLMKRATRATAQRHLAAIKVLFPPSRGHGRRLQSRARTALAAARKASAVDFA